MRTVPTYRGRSLPALPPILALGGIVRASRVRKLLPLLLLMTNAMLIAEGPGALHMYASASLVILLFSALGMQLNVLTDAPLDSRSKPELHAWLTANPTSLHIVMWCEGLAGAALWAFITLHNVPLGAALAAYVLCFVLYSYNVLARGAEGAARLKIYWWGNALTVLGGYGALWLAGFYLGRPGAIEPWACAGIAAALSCTDYAVFLNECAGDAADERASGLKTLPALLGERRTSAIAMALLGASLLALAALLAQSSAFLDRVSVAALLCHALLQSMAAVCLLSLVRNKARSWEWLVDSSFWLSRAGAFVILAGGTWFFG